MATQIAQTETTAQIANAQSQANAIGSASTLTVPKNTFVFFAGFDGTNNIASNPGYSGDPQSTAVGALTKQVADVNPTGSNVAVGYYAGVGTPGTSLGSSVLPTSQSIETAQRAYNDYAQAAYDWLADNPGGNVTAMMASFSRGSIEASIFSQMLFENGLVYTDSNGKQTTLVPPGQANVSANLMISPVTSFGTGEVAPRSWTEFPVS